MTESVTSSIEEVMDSLCDSIHSEEPKEEPVEQNVTKCIAKSPLVQYDVSRYGDYDNQIGETSICKLERLKIPRFDPNQDIPISSLKTLKSTMILSREAEKKTQKKENTYEVSPFRFAFVDST